MSDAARDTERLDRAIERLTNNQPVPVFEDDDLEELLQLAGRLHRELPDDLPDPLFRTGLHEQLLDPRPRLVQSATVQPVRRRNPLGAFTGAIAAVVIVAVAVGVVASGQFGGNDDAGQDQQGNAEFLGSAQSTMSIVATATATVGGLAGVSTRVTQLEGSGDSSQAMQIPPLDSNHVEMGALATTMDLSRPVNSTDVAFTLASAMPESVEDAPVYRFSVPDVDAMALFNQVTDALELDGEMKTRSVRGKTVMSFTSTNGTTFTWVPSSGAFACKLSGEAQLHGSPDEMVAEAYSWLQASGFPLRDPVPVPTVHTLDNGMLQLDFPVMAAPDVAIGHPLSVSITIDEDGVIRDVSGYWLQHVDTRQLEIISPEQAWEDLSGSNAFWNSRTPIDGAGTFHVESFSVVYVLTIDSSGEVVLQPVYRASGQFHDYRGSVVEGVTVLVQAINRDSR
jgi:hypothetical protein